MTQQKETQQPPRRRREFRTVSVKSVQRLTPHSVRVTLAGDALVTMVTHGPAEHLKVLFPAPGQDRPPLPNLDEEGRPVYPPGVERPVSRTFTPRRFRPDVGELDIDFVLHGDSGGPGSRWASTAKPGDVVVVTAPGGPFRRDPDAAWYVLGGDEAAVPAIGTILEALPAGVRADAYLEVASAAEELLLTSAANVRVTWLHRNGEEVAPGTLLAQRLRQIKLPPGKGRIFVACEAGLMRDLRKHLLFERELDREAIHTQGYWKQDEPNHPDHDLGQEI